uniref:Glycosyltransferase RgtA/B/C/D-like domain-containing protein n=1 Tax=Guillardia theta TaxID=55529 RepID=A0A7S4K6F2_GUITH
MPPSSKLALLSSFLGAAAASMQFAAAESLTGDVACSVFAAGLFAFSNTAWKFSTQFEVFALNNIFSSSILLLTLHFLRHQRGWTPLLGSFLCGLALTNQHTIVVLVLVSVVFAVWRSRLSLLHPRRMLVLLVLFVLGLSPYCYLFVAGSRPPMGSWGLFQDMRGLLRHVLREEYGTFQLYTSGRSELSSNTTSVQTWESRWKRNVADYWSNLNEETAGVGPFLFVLGLIEGRTLLFTWPFTWRSSLHSQTFQTPNSTMIS